VTPAGAVDPPGALVLDQLIRRQHVRADLASPGNVFLLAGKRSHLRRARFALAFRESRREDLHRLRSVLHLGTFVLA
jgi:hypothetical protein